MIWITQVDYLGEYKLRLIFSDGLVGVADLESTLKNDSRNLFKELTNPEQFKRHHLDMDTVVWENGLDLAPGYLRSLAEKMPLAA